MEPIISLREDVLGSLDFFANHPPTALNLDRYPFPMVVGSGNAYNTGTILFAGRSAVFADESTFRTTLTAYLPAIQQKLITQALIISASGEKDSVWEIEFAKTHGLATTLLTCNGDSSAAKIADEVYTYHSIDEPYTYNTSTYLGMILSATHESPQTIRHFLEGIQLPSAFADYQAYAFVLPDSYSSICPMIDIKRHELFGPHLSLRAFSLGHARHAKFIHRTEQELVISIGAPNDYFGHPDHRWSITLPKEASFGCMLALAYYLTGHIQECKPPYFKKNIEAYCLDYGPKAYGSTKPFDVIVPGK